MMDVFIISSTMSSCIPLLNNSGAHGNKPELLFKQRDENTKKEKQDHEKSLTSEDHVVDLGDGDDLDDSDGIDDDDNDKKEKEELSGCFKFVSDWQKRCSEWLTENRRNLKILLLSLCIAGYLFYFVTALCYRFGDEGSIRLLCCTCLAAVGLAISFIVERFGNKIHDQLKPLLQFVKKYSFKINMFLLGSIFVAVIVTIVIDMTIYSADLYNLVSISGIAVYIFLVFIFSVNPSKVKWRTVTWGFGLQFAFALMILRWPTGFHVFKWLGDRVSDYFNFVNKGSLFLFGPSYMDHVFMMKVLPTIIFTSSTISMLFHTGAMQWFIAKVAFVMQACMDVTAGESVNAAGNIFIGQTESPLLIRPILPHMTDSEIHAVMTSGFATVAGGIMSAYILFGVPANHLLSASVMSAPAALAIAKLSYPETKKSLTSARNVKDLIGKCEEKSLLEAVASGACSAVPLVANIAANLIAFVTLVNVLNTILTWFGDRVGAEQPITFEFLCSYVMWPFALAMGVNINDCRKVGQLIGVKTFINEFVAFEELGKLISNRKVFDAHVNDGGDWDWTGNRENIVLYNSTGNSTTLLNGVIEDRSIVISTYALCGFSNLVSIGVQLGGFSTLAPTKMSSFSRVALRAMVSGSVACFVTACIAGLFYKPET